MTAIVRTDQIDFAIYEDSPDYKIIPAIFNLFIN